MRIYSFESEQFLPRPLDEIFPFFSDPRNLERLTPPGMTFRVEEEPPGGLAEGAEIHYRLRVHGLPLRWTSRLTVWRPPHVFVDEQVRGPYRHWVHTHLFEERDGGTLVRDHVEYAVPGGFLADRLFVRPDLRRIFAYRQQVLGELFSASPSEAPGLRIGGAQAEDSKPVPTTGAD